MHVWQLGIIGTASEFIFEHKKTKKPLRQDGRS